MNRFLPARLTAVVRLLAFSAGMLAFAPNADAKIWRVDNNPGSPGDFTSAQDAHTTAQTGDTLYFSGSGIGYGNLTLTKKLYLFGPGYFLAQNSETQANVNHAALGIVTFNTGSSGSLMTGLVAAKVAVNTSNLVIKRNYISGYQTSTVEVASNLGNILILQNYLLQTWANDYAVYINGGGSGIQVRNNYIANVYSLPTNYNTVYSGSAITFANNVIYGNINLTSSTVVNNIMRSGSFTGSGNTVSNNFGAGAQFSTTNGNQQGVNMTLVFEGGSSSDGQFQLKAGSPAIGAGVGGVDIGMFGGSDPYVLSGLPAIPAIWFFNGPATGSGPAGLPIQVKVKSHN